MKPKTLKEFQKGNSEATIANGLRTFNLLIAEYEKELDKNKIIPDSEKVKGAIFPCIEALYKILDAEIKSAIHTEGSVEKFQISTGKLYSTFVTEKLGSYFSALNKPENENLRKGLGRGLACISKINHIIGSDHPMAGSRNLTLVQLLNNAPDFEEDKDISNLPANKRELNAQIKLVGQQSRLAGIDNSEEFENDLLSVSQQANFLDRSVEDAKNIYDQIPDFLERDGYGKGPAEIDEEDYSPMPDILDSESSRGTEEFISALGEIDSIFKNGAGNEEAKFNFAIGVAIKLGGVENIRDCVAICKKLGNDHIDEYKTKGEFPKEALDKVTEYREEKAEREKEERAEKLKDVIVEKK
jgi:hypothetical protein